MRGCGGWVWAQKKRGNVAFIDSISALFSKWGGKWDSKTSSLQDSVYSMSISMW